MLGLFPLSHTFDQIVFLVGLDQDFHQVLLYDLVLGSYAGAYPVYVVVETRDKAGLVIYDHLEGVD